ncbi:lipopolysaccharide biosynthesis protein [Butyricimonas hominis]|uniref:Lipopolysaccharide biosynthesis protein n=1 Tax=Butyricimonas hominis TaxID=2763032 RepID=A0ABR7D399_9BACT|nr:lipopolysaccharide biosynthesis protein [Butyricimonas hominis]MBC5622415.1 lipopolysaccharide biosynthesis protein [Butyricimonas hominis]
MNDFDKKTIDMPEPSLKEKTISGMLWSALQRFGVMFISFVANLILARLLLPEDFGCIGILMVFIAISNTFIDGGFGSALIQKNNPTEEDYSTIFYFNLAFSVFLYVLLWFSSRFVSEFYRIEDLDHILKVLGIILIINASGIIQSNQLRKKLEFKKMSYIYISSMLCAGIVSILLAYHGYGVWSLVVQLIINSILVNLQLWLFNKWYPSFIFSWKSFKELFGFGNYILLSNLLNTFCNNIQGLIIGRVFSAKDLGFYAQARKLEEIPSTSLSQIVGQVSYPVFSKIQTDRVALKNALRKTIKSLAFINFPLMILLIVIARPLIIFLFSEKWIESIPYFQILCIAGIAICLQDVNYYIVAAVGRSNELFRWNVVKRSLGLLFVVVGLKFGIEGILYGMVLGSFTIYIVNAWLASKYVDYTCFSQIRDVSTTLLIAILAGICSYMLKYLETNELLLLIIQMFSYLLCYVIGSCLFKIEALDIYLSEFRHILNKVKL